MAIFQAGSRPGTFTGTQENLFLEMKNLRGALLNVGLNELIVPNGFNATESGDVSQIPTARNTYSNFMWFAFSDPLQDVAPVYIGFRAFFGDYFNSTSGKQVFHIQSCVTREIGLDGVPVTSTAYYSRGNYASTGYANDSLRVTSTNSLGDFVRYAGDTLMLCFLVNSGGNAASKSGSFLLISRVGKAIQIVQDDRYLHHQTGFNALSIRQMKLPSGNTLDTTASVASRAGLFFFDGNNVPIVSPIYAYDENNQIQKLSKIFSFPADIFSNGQIVRLDFSGVEKPYLYLMENNFAPTAGCGWLLEWE